MTKTKRKAGPSDTQRQARENDAERAAKERAAKKTSRGKSYNPLEGRDDGILVQKLKEKKRREYDI